MDRSCRIAKSVEVVSYEQHVDLRNILVKMGCYRIDRELNAELLQNFSEVAASPFIEQSGWSPTGASCPATAPSSVGGRVFTHTAATRMVALDLVLSRSHREASRAS